MAYHALKIRLLILFSLCLGGLSAQTDSLSGRYLYVDEIHIEGNHKTRSGTILRELEFKTGDSLLASTLSNTLERNRLRLMNLGIFTDAQIKVLEHNGPAHLRVGVTVSEAWYVYPVPILTLSDRNFNVWWNEFNRSFKRINYGVDWTQLNLSGSADALKVKTQFGYTNQYELGYRSPGLNKSRTLGLEAGISYSRAHELSYKTLDNKLEFLKVRESWQLKQILATVTLVSRPKLFKSQAFTLEYHDNEVSDTIAHVLNPDYYLNGRTRQRHFSAIYSLSYDYRDIRPYPLHGWRMLLELRRNGLLPSDDLKVFRLFAEWDQYFSFNKRLSLELIGKGRTSLPRGQLPQSNNQGLGYGGNLVRGYDYYVMDGLDFLIFRSSWHFLLLDHTFNLGRIMPVKAYRKLPLKVYLAWNSDFGRANDPHYGEGNPLSNRNLFGYGPGLDFVFYYDKSIRCEWSWNDLGEGGFFIRVNTGL